MTKKINCSLSINPLCKLELWEEVMLMWQAEEEQLTEI